MINLSEIKKRKGFLVEFKQQPVVDGLFVKELRKKLNLSQSMFAELLNVKKKTVEKWEQGTNPISNGNAVAILIFNNHPELIKEFIDISEPVTNCFEFEISLGSSLQFENNSNNRNIYSNVNKNSLPNWSFKTASH